MSTNYVFGTGLNKVTVATGRTQTDLIYVSGAGNTIKTASPAANITASGAFTTEFGWDTHTTFNLGDGVPTQTGIVDKFTLHGNTNTITGRLGEPVKLYQATFTATVSGAASEVGNNTVKVNNYHGTNTLDLNGPDNTVLLNADATNTVTTRGGGAHIDILDLGTGTSKGWTSKVTIAGDNNEVHGANANFTVAGGVNGNTVDLGNGNNSVTLSGSENEVTVGDGTNKLWIGLADGSHNEITTGNGANTIYVGGAGSSDNHVYLGSPTAGKAGPDKITLNGNDSSIDGFNDANTQVFFNGDGNSINLLNGLDQISGQGDYNTIVLGDGGTGAKPGDSVHLEGEYNDVTTGAGADRIDVNGDHNTIDAGAGKDTINADGDYDVITTGSGNDNVTANGENVTIFAADGDKTIQALGDFDTINLDESGKPSSHSSLDVSGDGTTVNAIDGIVNIKIEEGDNPHDEPGEEDGIPDFGVGSTVNLHGVEAGSKVDVLGNDNTINVFDDSSVAIKLEQSGDDNQINLFAVDGGYSGKVVISGIDFSASEPNTLVFHDFDFGPYANGEDWFNNTLEANGNAGWKLELAGGGEVDFKYSPLGSPDLTEIKFVNDAA